MEAGPSGSFSSSASFLPDSGLTSASTSKKRARPPKSKDGSTTEENARKRAKLDASAISAPASMASASATTVPTRKPGRGARIKLPRPAKVNVAAKAALKEKARIALLTHPKWKTLPPAKLPKPRTRDARSRDAELKPRLWTGDRAEYLSIFPEMTDKRSANGICWHMYDYPTVLLDETNMCWELRKVDNLTLELFTTRTFVLPNHPTEGPELDLALSTMTLLPESEVDVKPSLDSLRAVDLAALKEGTPPRPKESLSQPKESSSQPEASSSQSSATRKKRIPKPSTPPSKPTTNALRRDRMLKVQAAIQSNCKADNERHSGAMDADRSFINDRVPTFALPRTPVARAEFDSSALQIAGQGDMKPLPELLMALDPPTSNKAASSQPKAPSSQSAAPVKKIKVPMPGAQVSKSTKNPPKRQQQLKMQATNKHQRGIDAVEPSLESMPVDSSTLDQSVTHQVKASSTQFSASIKASKPSKPAKDFSQRRHPNTRGGKQANSGGDDNHWESGVNDFPSHSRQSADSDLSHSTTTFSQRPKTT